MEACIHDQNVNLLAEEDTEMGDQLVINVFEIASNYDTPCPCPIHQGLSSQQINALRRKNFTRSRKIGSVPEQ